jgi:tetratricopeptide (TPR) repeat protein
MKPRIFVIFAALLSASAPSFAVTDAERVAVYKDFRTQFDERKYTEALPLAERLVALTEEQYGAEDLQLASPLANLGTVNHRLGKFPAAIENYQRGLRILAAKSNPADRAQIPALHGLGLAFLANNEAENAVVALKRALDLTRNTQGLFNIEQIEFIDPMITAYLVTGRFAEADKEAGYALRVEEAAYGRSSPKLLARLDKLARYHESQRRYTTERVTYERALAILTRHAPATDLRRVGPLRGIGRAYTLEFLYGVEGGDTSAIFNTSGTGAQGAPVFSEGPGSRRGEAAFAAALELINANTPVNQRLRGEVLADVGDWYLISNSARRAYDSYAESWKALAEAGASELLAKPRLIAYRPSVSSVDRSQLDPTQAQLKSVEMHFRVERDGHVENVTSPTTDVPEAILKSSMAAMRRSRYAPRIENGAAVATDDVVYIEQVLIRIPPPAGS